MKEKEVKFLFKLIIIEAEFNLENNIENYFYYTEEDKWDDSFWADHDLDKKFK